MTDNRTSTVPFTQVTSDFLKIASIPDNQKGAFVDYAATDFSTLRESLLEYMKAVYPLDYSNFAESDLGLMLVELISYMGAVLSMKADMLTHENFIHTAKDRDSVRKLFELIGISMKGPTSSQATAIITVDEDSTAVLGEKVVILAADRVVSISSPEDGEPLTYTIYTTTNGIVNPLVDYNADITFTSGTDWYLDTSNSWNSVMLEGAFATESGKFSELEVTKSIDLEEAPVIQNSVQVFVSSTDATTSGSYRQVENLFQSSALDDKIFQVVYKDDYSAKILFGNGNNSVTPATNSSYMVTYRVGGGSRGNIPKSYINSLVNGTYNGVAKSLRVDQVQIATGGADAESVSHAKKFGPLSFKRQDRLVSLEDYSVFASRYISPAGSTGKAIASTRKAFSSANIVDLFILEKATDNQLQKASLSFKDSLLTQIQDKKMITDDVILNDGLIRTVDLVVTINIDKSFRGVESTIVAKASNIIHNFFLADSMDFGDPLVLSNLNRSIFGVNEILYATVDNFEDEIIYVDFNEIIQLNNLIINTNYA